MNTLIENEVVLKKIELHYDGERFILSFENKLYTIGKIIHDVIAQLKEGISSEYIISFIQEKYDLTNQEAQEIVCVKTISILLDIESKKVEKKQSYVHFQWILFNEKITKWIASLFHFLFYTPFFITTFLVLLLFNVYWVSKHIEVIEFNNLSIEAIVIAYIILFIIFIFHELGHAAAAWHWKISPRSIGIGFYFILPVLFTNVTSIWVLSKYKRISVNLGGIYFQLIINSLFFLSIIFFVFPPSMYRMISLIIKTNLFVALYSFIPFLRNDGYWIYSDFWNIPNLMKKAYAYPIKIYNYIIGKREHLSWMHPIKEWALGLFSIGNYIFTIYFLYQYALFIKNTAIESIHYFSMPADYTIRDKANLLMKIIFASFSLFLVIQAKVKQAHTLILNSKNAG